MILWGVVPVVLLLLQVNCFLKKGHLLNPNDQNRDWGKFFIKTNNLFDHHVWILNKQGKGTWDKHFILFYSRKDALLESWQQIKSPEVFTAFARESGVEGVTETNLRQNSAEPFTSTAVDRIALEVTVRQQRWTLPRHLCTHTHTINFSTQNNSKDY